MKSIRIPHFDAKRGAAYACAITAASFAVWFAGRSAVVLWFAGRTAMAQTVDRTPVTVKYKVTTFWSDGQPAVSESIVAVRRDGSRVKTTFVTGPDGAAYQQRLIDDLAAGNHIVLESGTQSISTFVLSEYEIARFKQGGCEEGKVGGGILGYKVVVKVMGAGPGRVLEASYAPDLNCLPLQEVLSQVDANGASRVVLRKDAAEVLLGEPDPLLFALPPWPERSPSQISAEFVKKFGQPAGDPRADEAGDQAYYTRKSTRK
ncbi:MAG: hypothetical protein IT161_12415 [Bryobacterales bacterium]|nr:hypothetical protein [Bryobacterales bacterium]